MSKELSVALEAAHKGGAVLKKYFEHSLNIVVKDDLSPVTEADTTSEEVVRKTILQSFPKHTIVGEEYGGSENPGSTYEWYIDPLDGTTNFTNGIPIFALSLALIKDGKPHISVVLNPITNTVFRAESGKGAYWNDTKITVSDSESERAMVTIGRSRKQPDRDHLNRLFVDLQSRVGYVRNLGCSALELAYVARGGTEAFICLGLKKWDYAGGALLIQEAGGTITTFKGGAWDINKNYFIASNGKIHDIVHESVLQTSIT